MTDSVFIDTLSDKTIGVYIGAGNLVGTAKTARELHKVINRNKIDLAKIDLETEKINSLNEYRAAIINKDIEQFNKNYDDYSTPHS